MITEQMIEVVNDINKKFHYTHDKNGGDNWTFLDTAHDAVYGDCEDYALTIAKALSGGSVKKFLYNLLTRKCSLYYVEIKRTGEGHCILEWDGHYIDNGVKTWVTKGNIERYCDFKMRDFVVFIAWKLWRGKA